MELILDDRKPNTGFDASEVIRYYSVSKYIRNRFEN